MGGGNSFTASINTQPHKKTQHESQNIPPAVSQCLVLLRETVWKSRPGYLSLSLDEYSYIIKMDSGLVFSC